MKENFKSGYVTIIGRPNVGKSTLMNALIGQKIAITSDKPQTTRNRIQTVYTDERGQIIFLDTPGVHQAKNKLGEYMIKAINSAINDVDLILWLVEPSTSIGGKEQAILEMLDKATAPVVLVINKTDTLKDDRNSERTVKLANSIEYYSKLREFAEIVPISAAKNRGTDELMNVIFKYLPEGPMYFDEDTVTDVPERQIVAELIREKCLNLLGEEVPHGIAVTIEKMHERDLVHQDGTCYDIEATIYCERESHKGIIIGRQGAMLKKIGTAARQEIEKLFEYKVNLRLWVKVKTEWRESESLLKNFGYNPNDFDLGD